MNRYRMFVGLFFLAYFSLQMQAYEFVIKNLTDQKHEVSVQLKGIGQKPSEAQNVEAYGAQPSFFDQVKNKVQNWAQDLSREWSDAFKQLNKELNSDNAAEKIEKKLSDMQADINRNIQAGMLKVGAKDWVNDLNKLKNNVRKEMSQIDKDNILKGLQKLQADMDQKIVDLSNTKKVSDLDTALFVFGGVRVGFCVNKVLIDGKAVQIYGVSGKRYDQLQKIFESNRSTFISEVKNDIDSNKYTDMSSTLFGICFSRQFDIVQLNDGTVIAITREKL